MRRAVRLRRSDVRETIRNFLQKVRIKGDGTADEFRYNDTWCGWCDRCRCWIQNDFFRNARDRQTVDYKLTAIVPHGLFITAPISAAVSERL